jgi:hypothetical protein
LAVGHGDTERGSRLVETHADEVTQLHQFGLARVERGKFLQGLVYSTVAGDLSGVTAIAAAK